MKIFGCVNEIWMNVVKFIMTTYLTRDSFFVHKPQCVNRLGRTWVNLLRLFSIHRPMSTAAARPAPKPAAKPAAPAPAATPAPVAAPPSAVGAPAGAGQSLVCQMSTHWALSSISIWNYMFVLNVSDGTNGRYRRWCSYWISCGKFLCQHRNSNWTFLNWKHFYSIFDCRVMQWLACSLAVPTIKLPHQLQLHHSRTTPVHRKSRLVHAPGKSSNSCNALKINPIWRCAKDSTRLCVNAKT